MSSLRGLYSSLASVPLFCTLCLARITAAETAPGLTNDAAASNIGIINASASPTLYMPLTQAEQAGRISGLTSQVMGRKIFPTPAEAIAPAPYIQRDYARKWPEASLYGKQTLAEKIGNQGRARYAAEQGWRKLLRSQGRVLRTGPDGAYWDPYSGKVRVLEGKGGESGLKTTYQSPQGTNLNAVRSARGVLKSSNASHAEKLAAARVIKAAQENRLETGTIRTRHVQGRPDEPIHEGEWDQSNVAKEAHEVEKELTDRNPAIKSVFDEAGRTQLADVFKYRVGQAVAFLGLAGSGMLGWDAFEESREAWSSWNDPELRRTATPYFHTFMAAGKWGETATLGLGSLAQLGWLGEGSLSTFGRAAGQWFLPIALGVEGLSAGSAYYDYSTGRINGLEFYRRASRPAVVGIFTTGGAIIGACIGSAEGGVGAGPGAAIGAQAGAVVAIPFHLATDWGWSLYYRSFNERQQALVDAAVESFYGIAR